MVDVALASAAVALLFGVGYYAEWDNLIRFRYGAAFGVSDPIFGVDVGFYVFHLPFYELLQTSLMFLTALTLAMVLLIHLFFGSIRVNDGGKIEVDGNVSRHLSTFFSFLSPILGWGFYLDRFELLYSNQGVVYGAGYTAVSCDAMALWMMVGVSRTCMRPFGAQFFQAQSEAGHFGRRRIFCAAVLGVRGLFAVPRPEIHRAAERTGDGDALPQKLHRFHPDRLSTRCDHGDLLSRAGGPDAEVIARNEDTIQNIRLWDARPLLQTFARPRRSGCITSSTTSPPIAIISPTAIIRSCFRPANCRQDLPASGADLGQSISAVHPRLWRGDELRLQDRRRGFPQYLLENVPAQSNFGLKITQPAIYYGQSMPGYRIVDTAIKEFDYPKGNDNVYASYAGKGGIPWTASGSAYCSPGTRRHQYSDDQLSQAREPHSNPQRRA